MKRRNPKVTLGVDKQYAAGVKECQAMAAIGKVNGPAALQGYSTLRTRPMRLRRIVVALSSATPGSMAKVTVPNRI